VTYYGDSALNSYPCEIENRLVEARAQVSATCPTASTGYTGAVKANLIYDPKGRLFELTGAGNTTRFLYDGDALGAGYNASGAMLRR